MQTMVPEMAKNARKILIMSGNSGYFIINSILNNYI